MKAETVRHSVSGRGKPKGWVCGRKLLAFKLGKKKEKKFLKPMLSAANTPRQK